MLRCWSAGNNHEILNHYCQTAIAAYAKHLSPTTGNTAQHIVAGMAAGRKGFAGEPPSGNLRFRDFAGEVTSAASASGAEQFVP